MGLLFTETYAAMFNLFYRRPPLLNPLTYLFWGSSHHDSSQVLFAWQTWFYMDRDTKFTESHCHFWKVWWWWVHYILLQLPTIKILWVKGELSNYFQDYTGLFTQYEAYIREFVHSIRTGRITHTTDIQMNRTIAFLQHLNMKLILNNVTSFTNESMNESDPHN